MPATVADPNRSLDSEQISPATIAHHTVYEKTPNLQQSHICQWGAQPYLVGPLSHLVGKPPLSPWVSADFLPLTQVVNNTNSAIPLTEIFDRVFSDVCNSLGFEVRKQKKRGSGNNRVYRNLKVANPARGQLNMEKEYFLVRVHPDNLDSRDGFGSPVPRQPAHLHTQAESGAYFRDSSRVPRRRLFIYLKPPYAIESVPSLSGHATAYRWRSLPRVRQHRASKPQGSSERVLPWQVTVD